MINNQNQALSQKLELEYKQFLNSLKNLSLEEIINKSYEVTIKSFLIDALNDKDLLPEELKILLTTDDLVDNLYKEWLDYQKDILYEFQIFINLCVKKLNVRGDIDV